MTTTLTENPTWMRKAIHDFSENRSHENWLKLSKALSAKYEKPSARTEVLKGIIGHILTSK